MTMRVAVIGGGSWGTAFASLLAGTGNDVTLVLRDAEIADGLARSHRSARYLPGASLAPSLAFSTDQRASVMGAELVVLAVPSRAFVEVCRSLAASLPEQAAVLSLTKGLEPRTGRRLSLVAGEELGIPVNRVAVLSGPNHAEEVARGTPAATVIASADESLARLLQHVVASPMMRVYASGDVIGVELCAAAKNVIAVAAGISDGLGLGDNAKAALITRGLAEMGRLGAAFGADPRTFAGLAGLGDLVATCCSRHSRNRRAGELLAEGVAPGEVEERIGMVAEGLATAPVLRDVAREAGVELPITERVCAVLGGESPERSVAALMARDRASEY
jgi:glycerol-3-phosphate dehydrogenase (NAD(P)+)